jgi:hypothetical protein
VVHLRAGHVGHGRAAVPIVGDMPPLQLAALVAGVLVGLIVGPWLRRRR